MEHEKTPQPLDIIGLVIRFIKAFRKLWAVVLILTVGLSGAKWFLAWRSYTPYYQSNAIFSVSSGFNTDDIFSSIPYYDSAAAQQMATTFPYLVNTDMMRDLITAHLNKPYINGTIHCKPVASTNLLSVSVSSTNAQDAYDILCAVIDCYPQVAVYMVDNPQILVRQPPALPTAPSNPFTGISDAMEGAVIGLIISAMLLAVHMLLTRPISGIDDLKKVVNLPLLAAFPHINMKKRKSGARSFINGNDDPTVGEALRGLRTKVRKLLSKTGGKVILLTSTIPGEGKSTVAVNLALSLVADGHRVVLVDADLRNQTIFRIFDASNVRTGLIDCLNDPELNVLDALKPVPDTNLFYLSGISTRKRHYSIDFRAMRRVLDALTQEFDYVVMDTPPCTVISDTALLCRHADSVLYVVRQDYASQSQVREGIASLYEQEIPLDGCIFNDVVHGSIRYGYGYGYSYGYGYGYGYGSHYGSKYGQKNK